jgi:hypothetical protein
MCRRSFSTVVFCLFFTTILSIRCYTGTDRDCAYTANKDDCGSNEICQCVKYHFQCTQEDQACNENERTTGATIWGYKTIAKNECDSMQKPSSGYTDVMCCSTNGCNRPSMGKCSEYLARRRASRKLTNVFDF